jgi:hypothetical protein
VAGPSVFTIIAGSLADDPDLSSALEYVRVSAVHSSQRRRLVGYRIFSLYAGAIIVAGAGIAFGIRAFMSLV